MALKGLIGRFLNRSTSDNRRVTQKREAGRNDKATRSEMTVLFRKELRKPIPVRGGHAQSKARKKVG